MLSAYCTTSKLDKDKDTTQILNFGDIDFYKSERRVSYRKYSGGEGREKEDSRGEGREVAGRRPKLRRISLVIVRSKCGLLYLS